MSQLKTVGDLRKAIADLSDDYRIELRVRKPMTDEELKNSMWPWPFRTAYTVLEFDDVGVSDKQLCLGCEIKWEF